MSNKHHGSSLDDFLKDETSSKKRSISVKEVMVWQLTEAMQERAAVVHATVPPSYSNERLRQTM